MELLQLRYFQTVARMESITSAANYYGVPQPSMSQAISRLEESLGGVKLFDRRKSRVFLNDKGKLFLEYVDKALLELDKGVDLLSDKTKGVVSGTVRLKIMETSYQKTDIVIIGNGIRVLRGGNIQNGSILLCDDDVFIKASVANFVGISLTVSTYVPESIIALITNPSPSTVR